MGISLGTLVATSALLASCGGETTTDQSRSLVIEDSMRLAEKAASQFQIGVLQDRQVTKAEYEESLAREARCSGLPIPETVVSPVDGLRLVPLGADYQPTLDCSRQYRALVEVAYVATHRQVMEKRVKVAVLRCFRKNGYEASEAWDTIEKMTDGLGKEAATRAVGICVLPSVQLFYPDIVILGVGY